MNKGTTILDEPVAFAGNMALVVHGGYHGAPPEERIIWFNCRLCKRDLPVSYLDPLRRHFGMVCNQMDCPDGNPTPYPIRPPGKRMAAQPHGGQHKGVLPSSDSNHATGPWAALKRLTGRLGR